MKPTHSPNAWPKTLSVIIVSWNCKVSIEGCLNSLDALSLRDFETIIVDSNSQDGTIEFLRDCENSQLGKRLGLIVRYHTTNIGWPKSVNQAVEIASGKWLALCNPDITFTRDFQKMLHYAESNNPSVVCPRLVSPDGMLLPSSARRPTLSRMFFGLTNLGRYFDALFAHDFVGRDFFMEGSAIFTKPTRVDHGGASFFMLDHDTVTKLGYVLSEDYIFAADSDLFNRLEALRIPIVFLPCVTMIHEAGHSAKLRSRHMYQFILTHDRLKYSKTWKIHPNFFALMLLLDALFSPVASRRHIVGLPRKTAILSSAYKMKGMILAES